MLDEGSLHADKVVAAGVCAAAIAGVDTLDLSVGGKKNVVDGNLP